MCQAAPLARCSNHAQKAIDETNLSLAKNSDERLALSEALVKGKKEAREAGFTQEQIMNETTPGLEGIQKIRRDYDQAERDATSLHRDIAEQELHLDATPKGRKALEENENAAYRGFRLKNAKALNEWHKRLRDTDDSNGVRIVDKKSDPAERREFLGKEYAQARKEYNNAIAAGDFADEKIEKLNEEFSKYNTYTVGLRDPQGRRVGTRVAVEGSSTEDAEEVDYLSRQRSSALTGRQQSHHDQILARAKLNSIRKALHVDAKRKGTQKKKQAETDAVEYRALNAERRVQATQIVDDLKGTHMRMVNHAKGYQGDDQNESLRLSAKASAINDGTRLLETYREMHRGNEARAFTEFRADLSRRKQEVTKEAENATSETDRAMYSGAQGGFSLVLDKTRGI